MAIVASALASLGVLWGLSWSGAEDAVSAALDDHLMSQASLMGEHLRDVPVGVLVELGSGHGSEAVAVELNRLIEASGLHDAALLGPGEVMLGSDGTWLPAAADRDLIDSVWTAGPVVGPLYRADEGELYLSAYAPLPDQPGWVVAVEASATLRAIDRLAQREALASVLVLLGVAGLGAWLAGWIARPLSDLEASLGQVTPGDPPEALTPAGPREVFAVATAAKQLLAAIRDRDEAVNDAHTAQIAQLTRFAAEIAHELRNPLNAISLSIDRLARLDDVARRAQVADGLRLQLDELESIVARLVDLTRPVEPRVTAVDLVVLVRRVAAEGQVPVTVTGPQTAPTQSDPTLVTEVIRNLLLNAEQAGAGHIDVRIAGPSWTVDVSDDGSGITDPEPLFEWFHTTRARGSGLGLPLSRRIAEALGGRLELIETSPATFRLELPGGLS